MPCTWQHGTPVRLREVLVVTAALTLAACAAPPAPVLPTIANVALRADADINPTRAGRPAPVMVRIYQLSSTAAFEKAEFYQLLNNDSAALGTDLVKKDEYLLAPGTSKTEVLTVPDAVRAIGVFGAYREFGRVAWRATVALPPHATTAVTVIAANFGISAAAAP